ncbi:hypothetical protein SAMN05216421_1760 [Halopseudomonas xinjiangensis]|uniref:DUF2946 domain-containing protein n=1 Tax=Halopseudomonas xinjiangensis TaxID=487184 RepID=A0A1H1T978_9GAMM|nr:hypothetical protein [Halopseudomonas xinjiangensis]SDS56738.1 hypothetical protein SAMN05216421_1760 [Halopseudomonas xinjiangensis]
MFKPSHRRLHAMLACLAMLMHVLGMAALASASAETRLAYGIAGHCLAASAAVVAQDHDGSHHSHHLDQLVAHAASTIDDLPPSSAAPGMSCCCASAQFILAVEATSAPPPLLPPTIERPAIAGSPHFSLRQLWPAINPRASPVLVRIA